MITPLLWVGGCLLLGSVVAAAQEGGYRSPPEPLLRVMRAPPPPEVVLDPTGRTLMLIDSDPYPGIDRVAEPYLKLAGVRIEPRTHARHDRSNGYGIRTCVAGVSLLDMETREKRRLTLPADGCVGAFSWSPDGRRFVFENTVSDHVQLWMGETETGEVRPIEGIRLNTILEGAVHWAGGGDRLVAKVVAMDLGPAPKLPPGQAGPKISEAIAGKGESSTYEARDTLANPHQEALFDHYVRAQLVRIELPSGKVEPFGEAGPIASVDIAPDGVHALVETLRKPYSYVTTHQRFARQVDVVEIESGRMTRVADLPTADRVPVRGVPEGPRGIRWLASELATLVWPEALDKGDWKVEVAQRDRVMRLRAPFTGPPEEILRTTQRFGALAPQDGSSEAFVMESDVNKRRVRISLLDLAVSPLAPRTVWEYSMDEGYGNPGSPVAKSLPNGYSVVRREGDAVFLYGAGGSAQGDRPFLDRYDLRTGATQRLFRSTPDAFERVIEISDDGQRLITLRESSVDPPNVFIRTLGAAVTAPAEGEAAVASTATQVTQIVDPTPEVRGIRRQLVTYKRKDGVDLSFTLYLPLGYQEGTRVPAVLYAYPRDFADPTQAGQVTGSQQTFTQFSEYQLLLLAGYAIIDRAAFPIVGDPRTAYDTYLQQLVDSAEAAVDKAVEMGVVDRDRIGVTGHSHGALMTANLLAHSDLFRAGVASSGGYNKTLTPFGFQNERRSFWTAKDVYDQASTFFHADRIDEPLLIVHGEDDANPGTEPVQSPKLFQAIRGNGGTARLVMLPYEPHWYAARESNEHFAAEMLEWFDRWVKEAGPRPAKES
ncbi:MAG: S9 family peptidase [Verrucomicrobiales bacterium]